MCEWRLGQSCCGYGCAAVVVSGCAAVQSCAAVLSCAAADALRVPNAVPITRICITKAR